MAHVVAEPCIKCKFTDCVAVCPVDCFHEGVNMLTIDPDECIDCGACVDECPVTAIFPEEDLPDKWQEWTAINARLAAEWPVINTKQDPLPTAEEFRNVADKQGMLDESAAAQ